MKRNSNPVQTEHRRSFLRGGLETGAAAVGTTTLGVGKSFARDTDDNVALTKAISPF